MTLMTSIRLILLLLTAYTFNNVAAMTCESQDGRSSIECSDDRICCEINGELDCCTASQIWWVWIIIVVFIASIIVTCCIIGCCIYRRHSRRSTSAVIHTVKTIPVNPSSREVNMIQTGPYNQPSSYNVSSANAPPPYSEPN